MVESCQFDERLTLLQDPIGLSNSREITWLLRAWSQGDQRALEKLTPYVYRELHRVAHRYMSREPRGHTLQTTALINEAYVRLIDSADMNWQNRAHFFGVCARLMRQILTDFARSRLSKKRGRDVQRISLDESLEVSLEPRADLVALNDALNRLAAFDPRKSQVVELRFFGGLTAEEAAEVLKVSPHTVLRDWKLAKVWLHRELTGEMRDEA
jgi:RNA polymerase sigma factor (TIGR02999 family)